jgi:transposase
MHLRTILNSFHHHTGFVYGTEYFAEVEAKKAIVIPIRPRVNSKAICSCCNNPAPGYDTLPTRFFSFVPLWGFLVYFAYSMRRVNCKNCGVKVEVVPWGSGKQLTTTTFDWFIAHWAKLLSWSTVATEFSISWNTVFRCVETAVVWGRENMSLDGITAIGVDEIARAKGHKYVTLVYQIAGSQKRLLYVAKDRTEESFAEFFTWIGEDRSKLIKFICSDMWKPYLKVVREKASQAIHVLDRFHIMQHFSKAIDEVRAGEAKELAAKGKGDILKHSRWALLKRSENLTETQELKLSEILRANLRTAKAYLLKDDFGQLWDYQSPTWASKFIDSWTKRAMYSKLEPVKEFAKMIRRHKELILNWFHAKGEISNGVVEGFNNKGRVITKRAYGFRSFKCIQIALYHTLGELPVPKFTHKFW